MRQQSVRPGTLFTAMDRLRRDEVSVTDFANGCAVSRIYFTPEESTTLFRAFAGENKYICWEDFSSGLIQYTMVGPTGDVGSGSNADRGAEDEIEKEEREHLIAATSLARAQINNAYTATSSARVSLADSLPGVGRRSHFYNSSTGIAEDEIERQERQHLLGTTTLNRSVKKDSNDAFHQLLRESPTAHLDPHEYSAHEFSASITTPHRPLATPLVHSPSYSRHRRPYSGGVKQQQNILNDLHLRYGVTPIHPEDRAMELSLRYAPLYHAVGSKLKSKPRSALRQLLKKQKDDSVTVGVDRFYFISRPKHCRSLRPGLCFSACLSVTGSPSRAAPLDRRPRRRLGKTTPMHVLTLMKGGYSYDALVT